MAAEFGLRIEQTHPDFGTEPLLDVIADSADIATFVPERMQILWPDGHDLRRILIRDPAPLYPNSLIWRNDNEFPKNAWCLIVLVSPTRYDHKTPVLHHFCKNLLTT